MQTSEQEKRPSAGTHRGAAAKSLQCEAVKQPVSNWVQQQPIMAQKDHSHNGKLDSSQQKGPAEFLSVE